LVFVLQGCNAAWVLQGFYTKSKRVPEVYSEAYQLVDDVEVPLIYYCTNQFYRRGPVRAQSELNISTKEIKETLIKSMKSTNAFQQVDTEQLEMKYLGACDLKTLRTYQLNLDEIKLTDEDYKLYLLPVIVINIDSDVDWLTLDSYGAITLIEDSGRDIHWVKYELNMNLISKRERIYGRTFFYMDSLYTSRHDTLQVSMKQEMMDSLVSLTLDEYQKRLLPPLDR